jgi:hypothetical protein
VKLLFFQLQRLSIFVVLKVVTIAVDVLQFEVPAGKIFVVEMTGKHISLSQ